MYNAEVDRRLRDEYLGALIRIYGFGHNTVIHFAQACERIKYTEEGARRIRVLFLEARWRASNIG